MSRFLQFCVTFLTLRASSALCQDVSYDSDTDFSKFKTYKWVTLKSVAPIDSLTDEQIKAELDAALALKGLSKIDGDSSADLFIGYRTAEQVQEQIPGIDPGTGIRTGLGGNSGSSWTLYKGAVGDNHVRCCKPQVDLDGGSQQESRSQGQREETSKEFD